MGGAPVRRKLDASVVEVASAKPWSPVGGGKGDTDGAMAAGPQANAAEKVAGGIVEDISVACPLGNGVAERGQADAVEPDDDETTFAPPRA